MKGLVSARLLVFPLGALLVLGGSSPFLARLPESCAHMRAKTSWLAMDEHNDRMACDPAYADAYHAPKPDGVYGDARKR